MKITVKQENFCNSYIETGNASQIELKLYGKSWTIDRIGKMLGYDAPPKMETSVHSSFLLSVEERKQIEDDLNIQY